MYGILYSKGIVFTTYSTSFQVFHHQSSQFFHHKCKFLFQKFHHNSYGFRLPIPTFSNNEQKLGFSVSSIRQFRFLRPGHLLCFIFLGQSPPSRPFLPMGPNHRWWAASCCICYFEVLCTHPADKDRLVRTIRCVLSVYTVTGVCRENTPLFSNGGNQ